MVFLKELFEKDDFEKYQKRTKKHEKFHTWGGGGGGSSGDGGGRAKSYERVNQVLNKLGMN